MKQHRQPSRLDMRHSIGLWGGDWMAPQMGFISGYSPIIHRLPRILSRSVITRDLVRTNTSSMREQKSDALDHFSVPDCKYSELS